MHADFRHGSVCVVQVPFGAHLQILTFQKCDVVYGRNCPRDVTYRDIFTRAEMNFFRENCGKFIVLPASLSDPDPVIVH